MQGGRFFCKQHKLVKICNAFEHLTAVAPVIDAGTVNSCLMNIDTKNARFSFIGLINSVFGLIPVHSYRAALF